MVRQSTAPSVFPSPEKLETKQMPTGTFPIPAEVSVIATPEDLIIEAAALRGQLHMTDEVFASATFLSDISREEIQKILAGADVQVDALEDLALTVRQLDTQDQQEESSIETLQSALNNARAATVQALEKVSDILLERADAQTSSDQLASQILQQQSTVDALQITDMQKGDTVETTRADLANETKNVQSEQTNYTNLHTKLLNAQAAYQKNHRNRAAKAAYDATLPLDKEAKKALDMAQAKKTAADNAHNIALQEKQTSASTLTTAQQTLTLLQSQKTAADLLYGEKSAALTAAEADVDTAKNAEQTAASALEEAVLQNAELDALIESFLVDGRIASAITAVHDSAAFVAHTIETEQQRGTAEEERQREQEQLRLLASELAASLQETLDAEANRIGYAKMFVTVEDLYTGDTRVHIRFRNPGEQTIVSMRIGGTSLGNVAATTPTADGLASITLRAGDGYGGSFVLQLQDGQTREVLTEVYGTYDRYSRSASISTTQTPFDTEEAGMLAENPITPALHVGRIDRGTLLLVVETPFDQFYIDTDMAGILSTTEGSASGGTTFGLAQITVDTGRSTGHHTIRLYDRKGGQVIDTLTVYFDQPSRTLSLADPSDQYSGSSSIEETDLGQQQQAMQALQNIPLGVAYADIARNQRLNLYYQTEHLAAPYNLYIDADRMLDLLFATPQYVKYRPENIQQTIQQEWDNMGTYMEDGVLRHHYNYSHAQTNVELSKRQIVADFMGKLAVYEQGISECVQSAVNIFLGITQGQPEEPLRRAYDELYAQWSANGIIRSLAGIGIGMPGTWPLRMAAKEVFYDHWEYLVQTQVDVQNVRESDEAKLRRGELKDAEGNWHAATDENSPKPLPGGMRASQVRLATRILNTLNSSTDPRIRAIQNVRLQEVALQVASIQTTDPQEFQQAQQEILMNAAKASAADEFVRTHESDIGNTIQDIGMENNLSTSESLNVFRWIQEEPVLLTNAGFDGFSFTSLRNAVSNLIGGIFSIPTAYATNLSEVSEGYGMINVTPSLSVNANSAVGSLFINMTHMLFDNPDVKNQVNVAHSIQKVTGIPWVKIMNCVFNDLTRNASDVAIGKLADLFRQGQYAGIFNPSGNESMILSSATDKDVSSPYTFANQNIRIRFDYQTPSRSFDHIAIYLADENGTQILDTPVAYSTNRNYFIDVPMNNAMNALKSVWQKNNPSQQWQDGIWLHGNFKFKVAIWENNTQDSPALQGEHKLTNVFSINSAGNPFGEDIPLSQKLTGTSFGVDWDNRNITNSCVFTTRAIVNYFSDFYNGASIPVIANSENEFVGAARLMMDFPDSIDENGNIISNKERETPGFSKVYLNQIPQGTVPPVGAIMVWDHNVGGGMGHVGVVASNKDGQVKILDGNWESEQIIINGEIQYEGLGSVHILHNFDNVVGWLIPSTR